MSILYRVILGVLSPFFGLAAVVGILLAVITNDNSRLKVIGRSVGKFGDRFGGFTKGDFK